MRLRRQKSKQKQLKEGLEQEPPSVLWESQ